jgi:hypothetical protein
MTAEDASRPPRTPAARAPAVRQRRDSAVRATGPSRPSPPQANYRHWSPMHPAYVAPLIDTARDHEVQEIAAALGSAGPIERRQLAGLVHADLWGTGRFSPALHQAVTQGRVRRPGTGLYALAPGTPSPQTGRRPPSRPSRATRPGSGREPVRRNPARLLAIPCASGAGSMCITCPSASATSCPANPGLPGCRTGGMPYAGKQN